MTDPNDPVDWDLLKEEWLNTVDRSSIAGAMAAQIFDQFSVPAAWHQEQNVRSLKRVIEAWMPEESDDEQLAKLAAELEVGLTWLDFYEAALDPHNPDLS